MPTSGGDDPLAVTSTSAAAKNYRYNAHFMRQSSIPSVDRILRSGEAQGLISQKGRAVVTAAIRQVLAEIRTEARTGANAAPMTHSALMEQIRSRIEADASPSLRPVFNLTGTVLHTNLGRAPLPPEAVEAMTMAALRPSNVEFALEGGGRGDRDDHLDALLCRLTGAEAATVVNNNAAAVLLVLNTLASRKEVPTSRGELIEIGGSFRMPDIMARSGCRLREVGTTNRVHLRDYAEAIGPKTGLVMKVHTSNYAIVGFTSSVPETELARLCHEQGVPFAVDLGSGTLVDLRKYGLPHEPTPAETLANGADVVTFSGDKLLGGPQAGIIVGRSDIVGRLKRNPLKRALRVDKVTIAALSSVLALYLDPDRLAERLPVLRLLTRPLSDIRAAAERLRPLVAGALGGTVRARSAAKETGNQSGVLPDEGQSSWLVQVIDCSSQIGSGALPTQEIASAGLSIEPVKAGASRRGSGAALDRLAAAFRRLPVPVIGRVHEGAFIMDLRCLDDERAFTAQLSGLTVRSD